MGKKVSDFLKSEILSSVFYLAFGLCLLLVPDQTVNIICKIVFGLVMIASGIYHIVIYTAEKEKATILDLFTGVIVMVLGIFLFFTPQIVIKILPYLLGALVLVDSIWKIKGSYRLKKAQRGRWKIILIGCLVFIALGVSMLLYSFLSVTRMILFSGIILTADGVADIVFLIMIRLGMKKSEKLCVEKEQEENGKEKPWDDPADAGLDEKVQDKSLNEDETEWKQDTDSQVQEAEMEIETGKTADAADADAILDAEMQTPDEGVESPGREIREMLKNHDEPLEEWLAGFLFLVKGADWFVEGAASIAKKLGIPQLIIGLTIVAMGTSMPEAAVSITAAINKNAGITIGNVVGSNILNILIILGITAVITNVAIQKSTLLYEIPFMTVITIVLLIFGITGSEVTFIEGVIFWILFLIYLGYLFVMAKKGNDQEEAEAKDNPIWKCMLLMVIGGILVVKGSDFAVSGATEIARYFGMSERFIGLTIVALGTSLPELVTSVTAARRGNTGIAIGNIVGSNIFNILFVIGTTALICTVPFESKFIIDTVIAVLCGAILWIGTFRHKELRKPCGVVMLLCYVAYFLYLCLV